jgi:hypothetical protein
MVDDTKKAPFRMPFLVLVGITALLRVKSF